MVYVDESEGDGVTLDDVDDHGVEGGERVVNKVADQVVVDEGLASVGDRFADVAGGVSWEEELPAWVDWWAELVVAIGVGVGSRRGDGAEPGLLNQ